MTALGPITDKGRMVNETMYLKYNLRNVRTLVRGSETHSSYYR